MYWCDRCERIIEYPVEEEYNGRGLYYCPTCGEPVSDATLCGCGKWTDPEEFYCEDCREFISNLSLTLRAKYDEQTGREIDEEHLQDLVEKWLDGK